MAKLKKKAKNAAKRPKTKTKRMKSPKRTSTQQLFATGLGALLGAAIGHAYGENPDKATKYLSKLLDGVSVEGVPIKDSFREYFEMQSGVHWAEVAKAASEARKTAAKERGRTKS
jgi:hypothetical protein